jgi:hypothetical protein
MRLFANLIQGILETIVCGAVTQEPEKPKPVRDPQDKITPNLYVGKIIEDSSIKCEVVQVHHNNIHVKILDIYWERMGTYLDVGKTYPVFQHSGWDGTKIQVWEIAPKHMKRSTSQVILQWEEELGWTWDLDF